MKIDSYHAGSFFIFGGISIFSCTTCENGMIEPGEICHQISQKEIIGGDPSIINAEDFNNDSFIDLIVYADNRIKFFENSGDGTFIVSNTINIDATNVLTLDIDQDEDIDIVASILNSEIVILENNNFIFTEIRQKSSNAILKIDNGDYDGDSQIDIAIIELTLKTSDHLTILKNNAGIFEEGSVTLIGKNAESILTNDLDRDGDLDIVIANSPKTPIRSASMLQNDGTGNFIATFLDTTGISFHGIEAKDIDNDTLPELMLMQSIRFDNIFTDEIEGIFIYKNEGNFNFTQQQIIEIGENTTKLSANDFDADGDIDLFGTSSLLYLLTNDGSQNFTTANRFRVGLAPADLISGDFNNDSIPDVASVHSQSNDMTIILSTP